MISPVIRDIVQFAEESTGPQLPVYAPGLHCESRPGFRILWCAFVNEPSIGEFMTMVTYLTEFGVPVSYAEHRGNGCFVEYNGKGWKEGYTEYTGLVVTIKVWMTTRAAYYRLVNFSFVR